MKNQGKTVIKIDDLPARVEKLSREKIENLFGGCNDAMQACLKNSDCCSGRCTLMGNVEKCSF